MSPPWTGVVYLASHPTVTGTVNTGRISYLGCTLRTARLNDDCRPHPTTVAAAPHYPHTRPLDVPARLVYDTLGVSTIAFAFYSQSCRHSCTTLSVSETPGEHLPHL
jgi:hypothetical protein